MSQFGAHFYTYIKARQIQGIASSTIETEIHNHKCLWNYLRSHSFKANELAVGEKELRDYFAFLHTDTHLKPNTIWQRHIMLRYFYDYAVKNDLLLINPLRLLKSPRREREALIVLNVEDMKTLLSAPDINTLVGLRDRAILELFYSSALRRAEMASLRIDSFGDNYRTVFIKGKGSKDAVLPVGKLAAHFIAFYVDNLRSKINKLQIDSLFLSVFTGRAIKEKYIEKIVRHYGKVANLKQNISPHVFRYSIATHLSECGADIRYIQMFLRHESLKTTSRYIQQGFYRLQSIHAQTHPAGV